MGTFVVGVPFPLPMGFELDVPDIPANATAFR